jgi:hypothetical protein
MRDTLSEKHIKMIRDTYVNYVAAPLEGLVGEELLGSHDMMIAVDDHILRHTIFEEALGLRKLLDK